MYRNNIHLCRLIIYVDMLCCTSKSDFVQALSEIWLKSDMFRFINRVLY